MGNRLREMFRMTDRPADEFLPYRGHVTDEVVLLEDGTHIGMLRLEGKPLTLLDDIPRYAERRRRHAAMRGLTDTNITVVEHHICHDKVEPFQLGEFRSAFSREFAEKYISGIQKNMKSRDWFITVMAHPRMLDGLANRVFGKQAEADEALILQVESRMRTLRAMLREYVPHRLGVRVENGLVYSEIGEAVRMVLYGRWQPVPMTRGKLAAQIYTDRVVCGSRGFEVVKPGRSSWGVMLGFREYPEIVPPRIMDAVLSSNHRLVMTNSFRFRTASASSDRMALRQRRMTNAGDRAHSLREGLDDAIDDVQSGREVMGDHQWSLAVHADSLEELATAADGIKNLLSTHLALSQEEMGCFPAYWSQVPGCSEATKARHGDVKLMNFCSFSPLVGFPKGDQEPHWDRPTTRFISSGNTAVDYSPHARRVGNTVLMGGTGFGKTTTISGFDIMLEQNLVPRNGLSIIFDKDASNELSVLARNGYYAKIRKGQDSGMAPIKAISDTPEARAFMEEFTVGLIMADGKGEPPGDQLDRIKDGIEFNLRLPAEMRSLLGLRQFLDHGDDSTGSRLERWCRGGPYGWAFDGEKDVIKLDKSVVGIDNTELLTDDMYVIRQPAAAYQFFRVREKVGRGVRAACYVDEAASYLPDARFAAGFDAFSRELRKGNGMLWLAVHHPADLFNHPAGKTVLALSPRKFLFSNPEANEGDYRTMLKCSPAEIEAVMTGMLSMGEGTFLVKTATGSFIARMPIHDPEFIAVLSSDPLRAELWHTIGRELGTEDPDLIWSVYRTRYKEAKQ
jgi:type IV secretion system protein VirB4